MKSNQSDQMQEKNAPKKKSRIVSNIFETLAAVFCYKLFGSIETALGVLVCFLIITLTRKRHPDAKWPTVVGIVTGILVAFVSSIAFWYLLMGYENKGPTEENAIEYTQACLDMLTGRSYDTSILTDGLTEKEAKDMIYDSGYVLADNMSNSFGYTLNDEVREMIADINYLSYLVMRYSVDGAEKVENGFDITVSIFPLLIYNGMEFAMDDILNEIVAEPQAAEWSDEEAFNQAVIRFYDQLKQNLEYPVYSGPVTEVVRYERQEDGKYSISELELANLIYQMRDGSEELLSGEPTAFHARQFMRAELQMVCFGENDGETLLELFDGLSYNDVIDQHVELLFSAFTDDLDDISVDDETITKWKDMCKMMFSRCAFSVETARKDGDDFIVHLIIIPYDIAGVISEGTNEWIDSTLPSIDGEQTESELYNAYWKAIADYVIQDTDHARNLPETAMDVHVFVNEDGYLDITEETGFQIGMALFGVE